MKWTVKAIEDGVWFPPKEHRLLLVDCSLHWKWRPECKNCCYHCLCVIAFWLRIMCLSYVFFRSTHYFLLFWGRRPGFSEISIFLLPLTAVAPKESSFNQLGATKSLEALSLKVHPQRVCLPNLESSLLIQFPSLWSNGAIFLSLWNREGRKILLQSLGQHQSGLSTQGSSNVIRRQHSIEFSREHEPDPSLMPFSPPNLLRQGLLWLWQSWLTFVQTHSSCLSNGLQKNLPCLSPLCVVFYQVHIFRHACTCSLDSQSLSFWYSRGKTPQVRDAKA